MCIEHTHTYIYVSIFGLEVFVILDIRKETMSVFSASSAHTDIHTDNWWLAVGFKERKAVIDTCSENNSSAQWVQNNTV